MAERENNRGEPKPRVDLFTLIAGLAALLLSAYVLSDGPAWLPNVDLRWLLSGGAVLIGMLMLAVSVRSGRKRS